jgi:hypothetical protein
LPTSNLCKTSDCSGIVVLNDGRQSGASLKIFGIGFFRPWRDFWGIFVLNPPMNQQANFFRAYGAERTNGVADEP